MKEIKKITLLLLLAFCSYTVVLAQGKIILRGKVLDKSDKTAVIGANIIEYDKESRVVNGTVCDINGDFVLEIKDPKNTVKVSFIGYETKEIKIDPSKPMIIELDMASHKFDEVVVTAYSKGGHSLTNVDDRDYASSRVKVDLQEMKETGVLSVSDALQGKVSGLDILSASGDPGSGAQLVIRGLSSIGNNKPLIVIDGIPQNPVPKEVNLASANAEDISNMINIPVQDIKSVEILKDAASTAQYGSRGADGVLLIETHRGRMGKVQFDYTYKGSFNQQPPSIPMLNGDEYVMLQLEEWHNAYGVFKLPSEIAYDKDYSDFYNYSANTDWVKALTRSSLTHDHYMSITGGGEKAKYFTSLGYINEQGTTINTGSKRFSTRINLDYHISNKLLFTVQFNYNNQKNEGNAEIGYTNEKTGQWKTRNIREMAYIKAPNMSIWKYNADGSPTGEYFTPIDSYQGKGNLFFNPVAVGNLGKNDFVENNLMNSFILTYNLRSWLTFRESISVRINNKKTNVFMPYNALGVDWLDYNVNFGTEINKSYREVITESMLSYTIPFTNKKHLLAGTLVWSTEQSTDEEVNVQSQRQPSTDIQDPAIGGYPGWMNNAYTEKALLSGLVSINYKFADRYMFQGLIRSDAHSSFGASNRWGVFKSVSAAWRFSEESFFKDIPFLGESKLRVGWGVSGRQPWNAYARFAKFKTSSNGKYITSTAIVPEQPQLDNLKWESVSGTDIGLELNLFKDRLFIEGELYNKITKDILFTDYNIPVSSGYSKLLFYNGGKLENKGWEIMADYKVIRKENLRWSLNFNISRNTNSFIDLPDNFNTEKSTVITNGEYPMRLVEGEPIGSFFGFRYKGVYPTNDDAVARDAQGNMLYDARGKPVYMLFPYGTSPYVFKGGDAKYEDINHDGKIDLNDVVYIGDSNPDLYGGFGTSLKYKRLDISCRFQYRIGFDIINKVAIETQGMETRNNQSKAVLYRWRVQGQNEPGMLPRACIENPANNLGSDRYVEKGDFLRLLNAAITYRISEKMCKKLNLRTLNLTLSARKLLTFTNYSGQDPEVGQDASDPFWIGADNAKTPPSRIITLSVAVGF